MFSFERFNVMTVVDEIRRDPEQGARRLDSEYRAGLTTLARRICADPGDADELVNRTFAEVVANIDRYAEQSAFFGWMSKILVNLNANDHRRQSVKNEVLPGNLQDCPDEDAQDAIFRNLDHSLLRDAVGQLSPEMRDVVVMRYFMDLPLSRIAKLLSVPEGTVNSRLHYARLALAAKLGAAAKKPGGKAVLLALALCGLTALGAAVVNLANNGEARKSAESPPILASSTADQPDPSDPSDQPDPSDPSDQPDPSGPSGITGWTGMTGWTGTNLSTFNRTNQEQNMNATAKTAAVLASALALQTAAPLVATGETLYLTANDQGNHSSFDHWDYETAGSSAPAPSTENDYVVDNNKYIRVVYNRTFGGNSIRFGTGTAASNQGGLVVKRADSSVDHQIGFKNNGAILQNGYFTTYENNRAPRIISAGPLTVTAPESNPFRIAAAEVDTRVTATSFNTNNAWSIEAPIKGDAGTALMLCAGGVRGSLVIPASTNSFTIRGSMAEFYGKLIVSGGLAGSAREAVPVNALFFKGGDVVGGSIVVENDATATFESLAVNGSVVVQSGAKVMMRYTDRTLTTAGLELQADSILLVNNKVGESKCGKIAVTESLTVEKGAIVRLETHPYSGSNFDPYDWVVLTLPADKGTIPLENFECPDVDGMPPCTLSTNLVDGVWQLVIHKDAHDVLMANDDNDTTISHALPSACTNATSWKSGNAPAPGKMYVAGNGVGGLSSTTYPIIRTPYYPKTATEFVFAGDTLALGERSLVLPCSKDVTFPRLVLSNNSTYVLSLASVPSYLRGTLYLRTSNDNSSQKIQAYMRGLNTVAAEVSGPGTLFVMGRSGSGNPYGDIEFTALNTNFTGRIKVLANVNNVTAGTDSYKHERVFVTDARNLGGALDEFRADALELADYSVLEARNDVDLNVANRGVKVTGNAGFAAPEDVTLAISNDITWNGTARKTGAGTLALGGAPLIASGANAALEVKEGVLKALSTNALNGVAVTFDDGAYLLVDPATTDTDLARFGAVNLVAHPFGGKLPVAFDLPEGAGSDYAASNIAVCTVANDATAGALAVSAAANTRKMHGLGATYSKRANNDGTVTVLASIAPQAFVLVLR